MRTLCIMAVASTLAFSAAAGQVDVSDTGALKVASGDIISPATSAAPASLPAVGAGPIFHLDASQTNGWTFGDNGTSVRRLPSVCGSRYLMSRTGSYIYQLSKRDPNGGLWNAVDYWLLAEPELAQDDEIGAPVLDFGEMGSHRAMLFDYENQPDTFQKTNLLENIGTVIAVWNSANGGGSLLAGGTAYNYSSDNDGRLWMRGRPFVEASKIFSSYIVTNVAADNTVLGITGTTSGGGQSAFLPAALGRLRLDGIVANPWRTGMNGGWQIISLTPAGDARSSANGIGLGVMKSRLAELSGGMKVAEMLIYGECLAEDDVEKVERYLEKKWLSRTQWGFDGAARAVSVDAPAAAKAVRDNFSGTTNIFNVASGDSLSVGSVKYGRGTGARIIKQGAGSLSVGDLKRYAGTLSVDEGGFVFAPRPTPAEFPVKPSFHIDVSKADSITSSFVENGRTYVARIESLGTNFQGLPLCAVRQGSYNAPFLRYGMFDNVGGAPAPVLDFYDVVGNGNGITPEKTGAFLRIARDNGTTYPFVESICTLVAVVSPRTKGGYLVGNVAGPSADPSSPSSSGCYFDRTVADASLWSRPLLETSPFTRLHPDIAHTNGLVMINGVVKDVRSGYETRGFQVLALRVPASVITAVGAVWSAHYAGGFMLGELALWSRPLTEDEMRDASAHLYAKWFRRALPGYVRTDAEGEVPDVQKLDASRAATIDIAGGRTLRVGEIAESSSLSVSGGGTLAFSDGSPVSSAAELAADPSLDLDASDTNKMVVSSTGAVSMWFDRNHRNMAYVGAGESPVLLAPSTAPSALPVVDMGNFRSNRRLTLAKSLNSVRSAYVVMGTSKRTGGGGIVFGSSSLVDPENSNYNDFPFAIDGNGYPKGPFCANVGISPWSPLFIAGAERYVNGVATNNTVLWRDDGTTYDLYEVHLPVGAHISGICNWNDDYLYSGGGRIAEMVIYERKLSDREKVATRNHLMKKWLGVADEDLQPLPAAAPVARALSSLSGDCAVVADSLAVSAFEADVAASAVPRVSGVVSLPAAVVVDVANASMLGHEDTLVPVVRCDGVAGLAGCDVLFTGDSSWGDAGFKAKLVYADGALCVSFKSQQGLQVLFR